MDRKLQKRNYSLLIDAVKAWADVYRPLSEFYEYAVFVYRKKNNGDLYLGRTIKGMKDIKKLRANVVMAFIFLYLIESLKEFLISRSSVEAFIHTHPEPDDGYTNKNFSKEDLFTLKMRRIKAIYLVPFENKEIYEKTLNSLCASEGN